MAEVGLDTIVESNPSTFRYPESGFLGIEQSYLLHFMAKQTEPVFLEALKQGKDYVTSTFLDDFVDDNFNITFEKGERTKFLDEDQVRFLSFAAHYAISHTVKKDGSPIGRETGRLYIAHLFDAAKTISRAYKQLLHEQKMDAKEYTVAIASALLHDIIEETEKLKDAPGMAKMHVDPGKLKKDLIGFAGELGDGYSEYAQMTADTVDSLSRAGRNYYEYTRDMLSEQRQRPELPILSVKAADATANNMELKYVVPTSTRKALNMLSDVSRYDRAAFDYLQEAIDRGIVSSGWEALSHLELGGYVDGEGFDADLPHRMDPMGIYRFLESNGYVLSRNERWKDQLKNIGSGRLKTKIKEAMPDFMLRFREHAPPSIAGVIDKIADHIPLRGKDLRKKMMDWYQENQLPLFKQSYTLFKAFLVENTLRAYDQENGDALLRTMEGILIDSSIKLSKDLQARLPYNCAYLKPSLAEEIVGEGVLRYAKDMKKIDPFISPEVWRNMIRPDIGNDLSEIVGRRAGYWDFMEAFFPEKYMTLEDMKQAYEKKMEKLKDKEILLEEDIVDLGASLGLSEDQSLKELGPKNAYLKNIDFEDFMTEHFPSRYLSYESLRNLYESIRGEKEHQRRADRDTIKKIAGLFTIDEKELDDLLGKELPTFYMFEKQKIDMNNSFYETTVRGGPTKVNENYQKILRKIALDSRSGVFLLKYLYGRDVARFADARMNFQKYKTDIELRKMYAEIHAEYKRFEGRVLDKGDLSALMSLFGLKAGDILGVTKLEGRKLTLGHDEFEHRVIAAGIDMKDEPLKFKKRMMHLFQLSKSDYAQLKYDFVEDIVMDPDETTTTFDARKPTSIPPEYSQALDNLPHETAFNSVHMPYLLMKLVSYAEQGDLHKITRYTRGNPITNPFEFIEGTGSDKRLYFMPVVESGYLKKAKSYNWRMDVYENNPRRSFLLPTLFRENFEKLRDPEFVFPLPHLYKPA